MSWIDDLRFAGRSLTRQPLYMLGAVIVLALAIGATAGVFSAVHGILLRSSGIDDPERLLVCWETDARTDGAVELSYEDFDEWRRMNRSFVSLAAMGSSTWTMVLDGRGDPIQVPYAGVTASFFDTLGARPLMGRLFTSADDVPNTARVILLNYGAWVRRFASDPSVVGQTVTLDRRPYTVIGVMPAGFDFPKGAEFWTPVVPGLAEADALRGVGVLYAVGRLRGDVSLAAARDDLRGVMRTLRAGDPTGLGTDAHATPILEFVFGPVRSALWLSFAAVAILLLIACANISALLLTRASLQRRAHAIRVALGASRLALARIWMGEAAILALAGGGLGLIVCRAMVAAIVRLGPDDVPHVADVRIDGAVVAFTCAVIAVTVLLCGAAALRDAGAVDVLEQLNEAAHSTPGRTSRRTRSLLLTAQIALAVVLLVCAGLVVRSFQTLRRVNLGFSPSGVLTMEITPRGPGASGAAWFEELLGRVAAFPGVQAAGEIYLPPLALGRVGFGTWVHLDGQPETPTERDANPILNYQVATAGYFAAMKIPLERGRLFDSRDDQRAPRVVIVGASTAKRLWPGENPIGKRVGLPSFAPGPMAVVWRSVVGVVDDVRYHGVDEVTLDIYEPAAQSPMPANYLVVRTSGSPLALVNDVASAARNLDREVVIDHVTTLDAVVARVLAPWRLSAWVFGVFAAVSAVLAGVGLFVLVSLEVATRQREFAIRTALGASPRHIMRLAWSAAGGYAGAGLAGGLAIAALGTCALQRLLYGVEAFDAITYLTVGCVVLAVVVIALYDPMRRATRTNPAELFRG